MIKYLIIVLIMLTGVSQIAFCNFNPSYLPKDWPQYKIRFPGQGTLTDIFDAGIRPYRFPSLEKTALGFKHVWLSFEMKTGELLPKIPVEWADLDILKDGLISSIEMTSANLDVKEAELAIIPFLAKGNRTIKQLRAFLASAEKSPRDYDDPYYGDSSKFAISWTDKDGPAYDVFFKSTFDGSKPISIALKISFFPIRTPLQERSFYDVPIPSPPGYENISMDAPRNFGPDSAVEIARSMGLPITGDRTPEEYEKQWREANDKTRAPKRKMLATAPTPSSAESPKPWVWLIVIFGFATAVWLVRRWKLKSFF